MKKKTIVAYIKNEVQFYALEPLLKELKKYPYDTKILIDRFEGDEDGHSAKSMATIKLMKDHGFEPEFAEDYSGMIFDLCLTPYVYVSGRVKAKCILKYEYGSLNTKASLTYIPYIMRGFHGFLCNSTDGVNLLSVYGRTFPVDNLRFLGKKKQVNKSKKKIILFAPTYNDEYDAKENAKIIEELKKKYHVIVKAHHGINYLKINAEKKKQIQKGPDEYYGSEVNIVDLLMRADVCLANNSSVIGDAMRAGVPCVVFTHDIDLFRWQDFHTTQYTLYKEGKLLVCKDVKNIVKTVDEALTTKYKKNWKELEDRFFPKEYRTGVKGYLDAINYYLNDPDAEKAIMLHDYNIFDWEEGYRQRDAKIQQLTDERNAQRKMLNDFAKRKLYKISDQFYKLEGKVLRVEKKSKKKS